MESEDFTEIDVGNTLGGYIGCAGESVDLLRKEVSEDNNRIIPVGLWQLCDEIHSNGFPRSEGNVHGRG